MIFLLDSIHVYIATQSLIGILCGNAIVILLIHRRDENQYCGVSLDDTIDGKIILGEKKQ